MKRYEDGAEFESSTHMQKVADKKRLAQQREQKLHDNNPIGKRGLSGMKTVSVILFVI